MTINEAIEILEIQRGFTETQLAKAYRHALMVWHPDRFSGNDELIKKAQDHTREIIEAYDVLLPMALKEARPGAASATKETVSTGEMSEPRRVQIMLRREGIGRFIPPLKSAGRRTDTTTWIVAGLSVLLISVTVWSYHLQALRNAAVAAARQKSAVVSVPDLDVESQSVSAEEAIKRGSLYANGNGVPKDASLAARWYRKAAEQNNPSGEALLGISYAQGLGVARNETEAATWYRKAADQNDANGEWLLGNAYEAGKGVPKDEAEAVKWYRKAADQNSREGEDSLGHMYEGGMGVPKDEEEAATWYRKAAEQNLATAQYNLGLLYASGKIGLLPTNERNGVHYTGEHFEKDYVQAHLWLNLAGANGNEAARRELRTLERSMTPAERAEAVAKAKELFVKLRGQK